ncbi:MAG: hypothetical protein QM714_18820 [Nocardioides sp.]|uniref:hypothetical protein n=1 Tax=Nocardioides sp. TaxID=35761 RepID=UPI0039E51CB0
MRTRFDFDRNVLGRVLTETTFVPRLGGLLCLGYGIGAPFESTEAWLAYLVGCLLLSLTGLRRNAEVNLRQQ